MATVKTADNTELYVKDWGSGRAVVMLHGWPLSCDTWDEQAMAIAQSGYRAISYDRRGFGRSSQPWSGYDYDTLADDLAAVIDETGAQDVTLVGFSMGGGEVARYMSRHAGKSVVKAVLLASVVPYMLQADDNPHGTPQTVFDQMALGLYGDRAKFYTGFFKDFYGVGRMSQPVSNEVLGWSHSQAMQASLQATLACAKAFASTDFRPDLRAFTVPTLVIHGTADKIVPIDAAGRAAAQDIAQSTLLEYDGAPHGLLATHQLKLSQDLMGFIRA
ncbi:MAG: alpha/beta hydrolase [Burkholderiaceae bacterium]|nr:alpha/beta hydrolase [Burkholderiaceae bacterium]